MKVRRIDQRDANGNKSKSAKWYGVFVDHGGALRRLPLLKDRVASGELARTVDRLNSLKAANAVDVLPPDLARAVESMPETMRNALARWNIITPSKSAASRPLLEHLDDWKTAMTARDNTAKHVSSTIARVRKIILGCRLVTISDVSASDVQKFIADLRKEITTKAGRVKRGISAQSFNNYSRDARSFLSWMVRDKRCHENPLDVLENISTRTDRRHDRRALSPDEMRWLLDVTNTSAGERYGMIGPERFMLYRLGAETGLRAGELRSLTRGKLPLERETSSDYPRRICQKSARRFSTTEARYRPIAGRSFGGQASGSCSVQSSEKGSYCRDV